jgi:peroxiredoxin
MKPRRSIVGLLAVGLLALFAHCSGAPRESAAGAAEQAPASGTGQPAPGFTLKTPEGSAVQLADGAGQVQLLDFWATWCAPCREEIPMLGELQATYGPRGFRVLGIAEEEPNVLRDFAASGSMRYTNLVGTSEVFEAYRVLALPTAFLIDRQGRIVESFLGPKPRKVLESKIEKLL